MEGSFRCHWHKVENRCQSIAEGVEPRVSLPTTATKPDIKIASQAALTPLSLCPTAATFLFFNIFHYYMFYCIIFLPNWWNTSWTPKPSIIYSPHLTTLPKMGHYLCHFEFLRLSVHHLASSCAAAFIFNSCSHVFDSGRLYLITSSRLEKIPL